MPMPPAQILVMIKDGDSVSVERYTEAGDFAGDTWHQTLDEAKHQIAFEFPGQILSWREVPPEIQDPVEFLRNS
jgi:hypothetical protein